jgi:hypothetical protein
MPWHTLKVGGGGFTTGIDIAADGTKVCRIDVYGAYVCSNADPVWRQLITASSIPAADRPPTATITTSGMGVYEIAIAPSNPARFYMLWNNRVYRSDNRGANWTRSTAFPVITGNEPNVGGQRTFGRKMAVDPINPDVCYVGTRNNGLYQTLDGGTTWTSMTSAGVPIATGDTNYISILIAFDPTSAVSGGKTQGIYASSWGNGVYHTTNGGTSWTLTPSGPIGHSNIIVDQNGNLWLANYIQFLAAQQNLWKFAGGAWTNFSGINQGARCFSIAIDRNNANNIYVGIDSGDLIRSTNGGSSWTGPSFNQSRVATDVPWLAWTQETYMSNANMMFDYSGNLYFAEGIGVWKTATPVTTGNVWTSQTAGIESLVAYGALSSPNYQYPFLWSGDRPLWHSPGLDTYPSTHGASANNSIVLGGGIDYASSNPSTVAAMAMWFTIDEACVSSDGATWNIFSARPSQLNATTNAATAAGGTVLNFASLPSGLTVGMLVSDLTASPAVIVDGTRISALSATTVTLDTAIVGAGVGNGDSIRFYVTGGANGGIATCSPSNIIWVPSNNNGRPRRTVDGGVSWSNITIAGVPTSGETGWGFSQFTPIHCVCADRVTANKYYLYNYITNLLYRSTDGGATWAATANSPGAGSAGSGNLLVKAVPGNAGHVFYTGANSAFQDHPLRFSTDSGDSWTDVGGGLHNVEAFAFGKAASGASYPAVFVYATIGGIRAIWRADDFAPGTNNPTWDNLGTYPNDSLDGINGIEGDANVYGRAYVSFYGSGWAYFSESNGGGGGGGGTAPTPIIPQSVLRRVSRLRKRRTRQSQ